MFSGHFSQFTKISVRCICVSSASSVASFWLVLWIVGIQQISMVVQVSLGSSARVSLLMALVLFVVGVALVGMVVQFKSALVPVSLYFPPLDMLCRRVCVGTPSQRWVLQNNLQLGISNIQHGCTLHSSWVYSCYRYFRFNPFPDV